MNSKIAVDKIMKILGLTSHYMYEAKTEQGIAVKIDGELELGAPIYVSTEEGMIPAPDGTHKLDDGTTIEVADGKISKIDLSSKEAEVEEPEEAESEVEMSEDKFADINVVDGTIIRLEGEEPSIGLRVMKVGYDGTLSALIDGDYETVDGKFIQVIGGSIHGVQSKADYEKRKTGFAEAKSKDGLVLSSPGFKIGDEVSVIQEDGSTIRAKDQEYEIEIDGNAHTIYVTDGMISKIDPPMEAEGPEDVEINATEMAEIFAQALKSINDKLDELSKKQESLEGKFMKFSKEPAGSKVYNQKIINENPNNTNSRLEGFKRLREALTQN